MVEETLYPHEAIGKYLDKNFLRMDAAMAYIVGGFNFCINLKSFNITGISISLILFVCGWICQQRDYKYRGLE